MFKTTFGEVIDGLTVDGREMHSALFNENAARTTQRQHASG